MFLLFSPDADFSHSEAILYFDRAWFSLRVVEGSISGIILINKSCFIVAYSYAHRGAPGTRGRTGSGYVESEPFVARKYALKSASVPRRTTRTQKSARASGR